MGQNSHQPVRLETNLLARIFWLLIAIAFLLLLIGTVIVVWLYLSSFQVPTPPLPIATQSIPTFPTPTPIISTMFEVFAAKGWQDSGVHVSPGDRLEIRYLNGLWTGKSGSNQYTGPEGEKPSRDYPCTPLPNKNTAYNALIGKIWYGKPFKVGEHFIGTSLISGTLYLRMNDCDEWLVDNEGSVYVTIQISR